MGKDMQAGKRNKNTENAWVRAPAVVENKAAPAQQHGYGMGAFREEIERMKEASLMATKALEARTKELEDTVGSIMEYNRQYREENVARDVHINDINGRVEQMNDGMLEVREDVHVMTIEQSQQAMRIESLEKVIKRIKLEISNLNPPDRKSVV